jgi:hypothetical protein
LKTGFLFEAEKCCGWVVCVALSARKSTDNRWDSASPPHWGPGPEWPPPQKYETNSLVFFVYRCLFITHLWEWYRTPFILIIIARWRVSAAVLRIRIYIRMFLCFLGIGSGSCSQWSGFLYHQAKNVCKTLIPTVLWLLFDILFLGNDVNLPSKRN